jgi:hypothetical protein
MEDSLPAEFSCLSSFHSEHKQHSIDTNVQATPLNAASYEYKSMAYTKQIMFPMINENFKIDNPIHKVS